MIIEAIVIDHSFSFDFDILVFYNESSYVDTVDEARINEPL